MVQIELERLRPHPDNPNHMGAARLAKLAEHIRRSGRYEPLVVRPHPSGREMYQIVNGHHRAEALRSLGYASAACIVWDVSDQDARLHLATLNRLVGDDVPARRAALLEELARELDVTTLSTLLPESEADLANLLAVAEAPLALPAAHALEPDTVELVFSVRTADAATVREALRAVQATRPGASPSEGLVEMAARFVAKDPGR